MKKSVTLPDEILRKICDGAADRLYGHLKECKRISLCGVFESHIEMALQYALNHYWGNFVDGIRFDDAGTLEEFMTTTRERWENEHPHSTVLAAQQVAIGQYRVDFLLGAKLVSSDAFVLYAIECDGHDFQERTKEQAARDEARDRALLSAGIKTIRFTGSEIWADPMKCADAVHDIIDNDTSRTDVRALMGTAA